MVPTPSPEIVRSMTRIKTDPDYKQYNVVSSWFKSFGDAPNGFKEELKELTYSVGVEYWYNKQFAMYRLFYENPYKGNRQFLTFGLGVNTMYLV